MLQWLSCGECYDVQLICGGHVFNAHRAVLASVSSFLRCLLLSCPDEDHPTYIALPEFEQDAMASVLYYIYNGEVLIPMAKLNIFLDTVKALQIYIDSQYLPENTGIIQESCYINDEWPQREFCNDANLNSIDSKKIPQAEIQKGRKTLNMAPTLMPKTLKFTNLKFKQKADISEHSHCTEGPINKRFKGNLLTDNLSRPSLQLIDKMAVTNEFNIRTCVSLNKIDDLSCKKRDALDNPFDAEEADIKKNIRKLNNGTQVRSFMKIVHKNEELENISKSCLINSKRNKNPRKIHNEVLQSPWCPKLPQGFHYRPFCMQKYARRKKSESEDTKIKVASIINDNNNKTDVPPSSKNKTQVPQGSTGEDSCCQIYNSVETCNALQHSCTTRYTCSDCNKTFSQHRNFKYHVSKHRGTKEFATTCPVCGKHFNDRGYLSSHMKIHRNRKEYKCSICPKSFNQRVAYNMHLRIHTGVKPHVCDECGKGFSRKMLLKQHQRTHSGERPYACPRCDKKFADKSNMTLHLRLHTGVKPFECSECGKSFTKKHHLQSHMNFHSGVKPYSCPKCNLAFTQSSNMRTHLKKCCTKESSETDS